MEVRKSVARVREQPLWAQDMYIMILLVVSRAQLLTEIVLNWSNMIRDPNPMQGI